MKSRRAFACLASLLAALSLSLAVCVFMMPREDPGHPRLSTQREVVNDARFSYVMYAGDPRYVAGVVVVVKVLKLLGCKMAIALMHSCALPAADAALLRALNVTLVEVHDFQRKRDAYYRTVMLKLNVFNLTEYDRVVYVEADGVPLKNLDRLFDIAVAPAGLAAPAMHWGSGLTSILMVVEPSAEKFEILTSPSDEGEFDMDVLNDFCDGLRSSNCTALPSTYGFLNGLLADEYPKHLRGFAGTLESAVDVLKYGHYVHFTSVGKPWDRPLSYLRQHMGTRDITDLQLMLWEDWYRIRDTPLDELALSQIDTLRISNQALVEQKGSGRRS